MLFSKVAALAVALVALPTASVALKAGAEEGGGRGAAAAVLEGEALGCKNVVEASADILALEPLLRNDGDRDFSLMGFVCSLVFNCLSGGSINVFTACELRRLFFSFSSSLGGLSKGFSLAAGLTIFGGSFETGECKGAAGVATVGGAAKVFVRCSCAGAGFCCLGSGKSGKLELELSECVIMGEDCNAVFVVADSLGNGVTPSIVAAGKLSVSLKSKFKFLSVLRLASVVIAAAGGFVVAFVIVAETLEEEEEVDREAAEPMRCVELYERLVEQEHCLHYCLELLDEDDSLCFVSFDFPSPVESLDDFEEVLISSSLPLLLEDGRGTEFVLFAFVATVDVLLGIDLCGLCSLAVLGLEGLLLLLLALTAEDLSRSLSRSLSRFLSFLDFSSVLSRFSCLLLSDFFDSLLPSLWGLLTDCL
ncbi:hypothetical protein FF38_14246 [Lucilia cuprina]|uniref:Uncharacterized protein n=1 Tax=Lucilia cuprina TaxID=7375 RepID=A0A0L0BPM9_LUCCU|nr:hypothetical protein FF38_14246 [Lucilia cuprina]